MALTAEQQAQVDVQTAIEDHRNLSEAAAENRRIKLEMVRLAKEIIGSCRLHKRVTLINATHYYP